MNLRLTGALLAIFALTVTGLSTGGRVYYLVAALLTAMLLIGLVSGLWALFSVRVSVRELTSRAFRGDRLPLVFSVWHSCLMPIAGIVIEMDVPSQLTGIHEVTVRATPLKNHTFRQLLLCPHRGVYQVGIRRVRVRDVFGLFQFSRKIKTRGTILEVAPRQREGREMALGSVDSGPMYYTRATEDTASPSDVRAWQEGDSLKKVHWKLSMRRRQMVVRTYEEGARPDTLILPDLSGITALQDQALTLEDGICEACLAAAKAQLDAGYPVRMPLICTRPQELSAHHIADLAALSDALMRVPFDNPTPYEQVLMTIPSRMMRTGGAVLVTARLTSRVADMALKLRAGGARIRLVWVSEEARDESLQMLERLKMDGVEVERVDPLREGQ